MNAAPFGALKYKCHCFCWIDPTSCDFYLPGWSECRLKPANGTAESTISLDGMNDHGQHIGQCNACPCICRRELLFLSGFVETRKTLSPVIISDRKALDWWAHFDAI